MAERPAAPSGGQPIRVHVIAEHAALRHNLGLLLEGEGMSICRWAGEPSGALAGMPPETDAVIVALSGPWSRTLQLLKELTARPNPPAAIVLSVNDDDYSVREALAAGASAVISSRRASATLPSVIREVVGRHTIAPLTAAPKA